MQLTGFLFDNRACFSGVSNKESHDNVNDRGNNHYFYDSMSEGTLLLEILLTVRAFCVIIPNRTQ